MLKNKIYKSLSLITLIFFFVLIFKNNHIDTSFSINNYKGKWLIINYWAEWCLPCIKEISELNKLNAEYNDKLKVLGVNFDRLTGNELFNIINKMGISFENLENDPSSILKLSRPTALPTTYIFNKDGNLSFKLVGPQTMESLLKRMKIEKNSD